MVEERPPKFRTIYRGIYINSYSGGDKAHPVTDYYISRRLAIDALEAAFSKQAKEVMLKDRGGYIEETKIRLAVTRDGIEQDYYDEDED
jgi:hypothetical protein